MRDPSDVHLDYPKAEQELEIIRRKVSQVWKRMKRRTELNNNLGGVHEDSEHPMTVVLDKAQLTGTVSDATLRIGPGSRWTATGDSTVTLAGTASPDDIDAAAGVTIKATAGAGTTLNGRYQLAGGGTLVVES